jgi:hypothetical protein
MSTNIETKTITNAILSTNQILLAEVDSVEVTRIKSSIDLKFKDRIRVVKSYEEILESIAQEKPKLLILGRIDKFNYFDTCKGCHEIWEYLPIFLLSRQEIINESFLKLAKSRGLTDIINLDSTRLNQLFETVDNSVDLQSVDSPPENIRQQQTEPAPLESSATVTGITGRSLLGCLGEIVMISNNYFGPLAQGNYWRKAHGNTIDKFPSLVNWSADHFSKITCNDNILESELTAEDIQSLRIWVQFFISECERIIIDFGDILNSSDLSPLTKDLLTKS